MRGRLPLGVALALGLLTGSALAAERAQPADAALQAEVTRTRHLVQPRPDPGRALTDVTEGSAEIEARARGEHLLQEARRPLPRRPDLDPTVSRGIQSRNLQRALGR